MSVADIGSPLFAQTPRGVTTAAIVLPTPPPSLLKTISLLSISTTTADCLEYQPRMLDYSKVAAVTAASDTVGVLHRQASTPTLVSSCSGGSARRRDDKESIGADAAIAKSLTPPISFCQGYSPIFEQSDHLDYFAKLDAKHTLSLSSPNVAVGFRGRQKSSSKSDKRSNSGGDRGESRSCRPPIDSGYEAFMAEQTRIQHGQDDEPKAHLYAARCSSQHPKDVHPMPSQQQQHPMPEADNGHHRARKSSSSSSPIPSREHHHGHNERQKQRATSVPSSSACITNNSAEGTDVLNNYGRFTQENYECSFCEEESPTFHGLLCHIAKSHPWYDLSEHWNVR